MHPGVCSQSGSIAPYPRSRTFLQLFTPIGDHTCTRNTITTGFCISLRPAGDVGLPPPSARFFVGRGRSYPVAYSCCANTSKMAVSRMYPHRIIVFRCRRFLCDKPRNTPVVILFEDRDVSPMIADTFNVDDPTSGFEDITLQSITKACALATHQLTHFLSPR